MKQSGTIFAFLPSQIVMAVAASAAPPHFDGLGDLSGGPFRSAATAVSADGSVVVGYSDSGNGEEAFRWTRGTGIYGLGSLGGDLFISTARAVSADGTVVIGDSSPPDPDPNSVWLHAFRWTMSGAGPGGVMVSLGDLPGGDNFAIGAGCSADGDVVVGHSSSTASGSLSADAYRRIGAGPMSSLGDLPGGSYFSVATGASADGEVICGYSSSTASGAAGSEGFVWTSTGGMQGIGDLAGGAFGSSAFAISADGVTVVGVGVNVTGVVGFRWRESTGFFTLRDLAGGLVSARANSVSGDGAVIVGQGHTDSGFQAALWTENGGNVENLRDTLIADYGLSELEDWTLEVALGVSEDGTTIVGYGVNPSGQFEAWRAYLGNGCALAGDIDYDDDVDINDLAVLLSNYAESGVDYTDGDLDDNDVVDIQDLAIMLANFAGNC